MRVRLSRVRSLTVLAAALLLLGATACGSGTSPVAGEEFRDMGADHVLTNVRINVTAEGIRRAVVLGDTAYVYEDSALYRLAGVHVTLYDEQGIETADLTAERGQVNTRTEAMVAVGDVVLVSRVGGQRIETEQLHFDPGQDRIWSDVETTLYEDGTAIVGDGFTSDANLQTIRVQQPRGRVEGLRIEF